MPNSRGLVKRGNALAVLPDRGFYFATIKVCEALYGQPSSSAQVQFRLLLYLAEEIFYAFVRLYMIAFI